ncbi:hypothetical protein [Pararhizobium sp. IMCC21322]|uniref:hypothetical protein n=1 Tax=Pararhizobium sp. IMCC21322 TaxID=3067903 RepID=UPI002741EA20|nr:hypothetical protein [Pararhizobium sp. IMCC21322]
MQNDSVRSQAAPKVIKILANRVGFSDNYIMKDDVLETIQINVYPWAVPTEAQKRAFDRLSTEEKRQALEDAIEEGFSSGVSDKAMSDIIAEAKADIRDGA